MRNPERLCISVRTLKAHQLYKSLRRLESKGKEWSQIYIELSVLFQEQLKKVQKSTVFPTILFLLSYSVDFKATEVIKISGIPVSVPVAFSLFVASTWLFLFAIQIQTVIILIQARFEVSNRLRKQGIDSSMLGLFLGKDDTELTHPYVPDLFFSTKLPINASISVSSLIGYFSVLLVLCPVWVFTLLQQYFLVLSDVGYVEKIAAGAGLLLLFCSLAFLFCFNLPVKYCKNSSYVRWNFLASMSGKSLHPQANKWLAELEKNREPRR